jgi:hypothetical protein
MNYRRRLDALPRSGSLLQSNGGKDERETVCDVGEPMGEEY